ncbi:MAG: hypothetical protein CMJ18_09035 [Phycisphaeraceae bacterium]|nr:hypothetical protein [Phycisphaeraceae bacterium]
MSQFNAPAYEIERPTGRCSLTDSQLVPGEPYMATLVELTEQEIEAAAESAAARLGFRRLDVCWAAWQEGKRPERIFCYWKSTVAEPNKKKKLFVDDHVLVNLFRRLAEAEQPQRKAFRFVLGLILMRKKLLRYDGTVRRDAKNEQGEKVTEQWWQVTPKLDLSKGPLGKWNEEDPLEMVDPQLEESRIQQVTEQLHEVLEAELE